MNLRLHVRRQGVNFAWLLGLLLTFCSLPAHAIQLRSETNLFLGPEERLDEELWLLADEVTIHGDTADDLLVLSRTFKMGGTAEGDVWVAAEHVAFYGTAQQQMRVAAQSLTVSGRVERSLAAAAATILVTSNAVVGGDVLAAADTATLQGTYERNLQVAANRVTLQGRVRGNVRVFANDIVLLPGTVIEGDFVYTSDKDVVPGKGVTVDGVIERRALPDQRVGFVRRATAAILHTLAALLTGLVVLRLFPAAMGRSARAVRQATGRCILVGVAALLLVPFVALAGVLVAVTRPLGLMAGGLLFASLYVGKIAVAIVLGSALLRYRGVQGFPQALAALAAGLGVLYILSALPTIGVWVWLVASTLGSGALITAFMTRTATPPPVPPELPGPGNGPETDLDRNSPKL